MEDLYYEYKKNYIKSVFANTKKDFKNINKFIPKSIYKYVALSENKELNKKKIECVEQCKLHLSSPDKFNDPYDCELNTDITEEIDKIVNKLYKNEMKNLNREERRILKKKKGGIDNEIKKEKHKLKIDIKKDWDDFKKEILVCCLSEKNNSMLMWSHYANSHNGFCIEYDFKELNDYLIKKCIYILPVIYSDKLQALSCYNNKRDMELAGIYATTCKAKEWEYEHEWRIIDTNSTDNIGKLVDVPKPKKIYLGKNIEEENKKKLLDLSRILGIDVLNVKLNPTKYELIFK